MRAGKKQAAEIVKTRPCIVYLRNLRDEEEPPAGRLRKRDNQREAQQELRETRTRRRSVVQEKPPATATPRTRHAVKPAAISPSPPPAARAKITREQPAANLAKRRGTMVLGGSAGAATPHHKLGLIKPRRFVQQETTTPKMYKQSPAAKHTPASPPPTIAASRSRRSIKPNPKYASDDIVTPKFMASLGDGGNQSVAGRHGRQGKQNYATDDDDMSDQLDLDEDDDDELADAAFNPQLHKSDEDDDDDEDEDLSEAEHEQELRRKLPPVKRGRGRPPKASTANAASASSRTPRAGSQTPSGVANKVSINSAGGRTAPNSLQQLRRAIAVNVARNNASLTEGSGAGSGSGSGSMSGAAKRKLEISDTDSPVARKRMVLSSTGGQQVRSVPVVNGKTNMAGATTRPKMGLLTRTMPQRRGSNYKANTATNATSNSVGATSTTRSSGGGAASSSEAKNNESGSEDVPTFTIVNIDDIINQDDVLITRSTNAGSAATGGNLSKKQPVGRPRTRPIPSGNVGSGEKKAIATSPEKSPSAPVNNSSTVGGQAKRIKILSSNSSVNTKMGPVHIQSYGQSQSQSQTQLSKPRPRILNAEMGKKTQPMKPLMNMGKELCPTDVDTEEDDPDPDLDFDIDEIPASIVTRKTPKPAAASSATSALSTATGGALNKWSSNRSRPVLSTTASSANARADRKLTKLLGDGDDQPVFKKPGLSPQRRSKENQLLQQQEQRDKEVAGQKELGGALVLGGGAEDMSNPKYFPPETTTFCEEDGRVVKKITCYETWHVISTPKETPSKATRQQRTCLELALVKLANVAARIRVPSGKWSSKVTLYKVSPTLMTRQTMTIFTGDLKAYNIPEEERHKYQPSCVLFRRAVMDRNKCRVPYDRAIIFKNKCFYANIDGKHVNLMGAPETVTTVKDVEILLDIVDRLTLGSNLVEMVNTK
ncbi:uncharacterized protein LOC108091087 [Drosophila ficusphila]|uniref:uncharacterized protein LOC108091087 n=1 Tax=Drosophila ficusphila TaxID=30025 RepID=UPI0007E8630C|nr:uncharacterized protein LOC108091087 [Drosophila ficusphila]